MLIDKIRRVGEMRLDELRFRLMQKWRIQQEKLSIGRNGHASGNWRECWDIRAVADPTLQQALESGQEAEALSLLPAYFFNTRTRLPLFFFGDGRNRIVRGYEKYFPGRKQEICAAADALCEHRLRVFAYPEISAGAEIPWRRDLVHGKETGLEHGGTVPYLDFEKVGDSKIVWEPNRHQHFFTLGRAYVLTGEERFAEECLQQVEQWHRENPYPRGINWASSLEAAFRVWSWIWMLRLLAGSSSLNARRLAEVTAGIAQHADYIANNLSTFFSPNTHLLGEGFALFMAGLFLPELRGADQWRETGRAILIEQMIAQVRPDGSHMEQSSYYHRYATDFFLCAAILDESSGEMFPEPYREQMERMCEFLMHTCWPSGHLAATGDADGGLLLPLSAHDPSDARATLSTAAVYFRRGDFKRAARGYQEETFWLLGTESAQEFAALEAAAPKESSRTFTSAGWVTQRSEWSDRTRLLLFDAGPQGMGACGHGHADALQVLCSADGVDWLVDPGTFVYTSSREWRDFFRSTRAHNTLVVDGVDQAIPVDFFKWRKIPKVRLEFSAQLPRLDVAIASHDGYAHSPDAVTHRRSIVFVKPDYWIVSDEVCGAGKHKLEFAFHFAPGVELKAVRGDWLASKNNSQLLLVPPAGVECRVVSGQEVPKQGWYSGDYGHREPAAVLIATANVDAPARFHWLLWPAPATWPRLQELPGPGLQLAVETEAWTDRIMLRSQQLHPQSNALWTDAELAFLRREKGGGWGRFIIVNGCCVENDGHPLLSTDSMVDELDVVCEDDMLEIHALPVRRMGLHAPHVKRAHINGRPAAFKRHGPWIEFRGLTHSLSGKGE